MLLNMLSYSTIFEIEAENFVAKLIIQLLFSIRDHYLCSIHSFTMMSLSAWNTVLDKYEHFQSIFNIGKMFYLSVWMVA